MFYEKGFRKSRLHHASYQISVQITLIRNKIVPAFVELEFWKTFPCSQSCEKKNVPIHEEKKATTCALQTLDMSTPITLATHFANLSHIQSEGYIHLSLASFTGTYILDHVVKVWSNMCILSPSPHKKKILYFFLFIIF